MQKLSTVAFLSALLVSPLAAQTRDRFVASGDWSLSFSLEVTTLSTSSASFGLWRMMSGRLNLGLGVDLGGSRTSNGVEGDSVDYTQTGWSVRIEPAAKLYLKAPRTVGPYLFLASGPQFTWGSSSTSTGEELAGNRTIGLGTVGGIGVDWFPVHWFSAGARTGVRLDIRHFREDAPSRVRHLNQVTAQTFSSNILIHVYF